MNSTIPRTVAGAAFLLLAFLLYSPGVSAGPEARVSRAAEAFWAGEYAEVLELTAPLIDGEPAASPNALEARKWRASALVAMGDAAAAREEVARMLDADRRARFSPDYEYPPAVIELFHTVRDSLYPGTMDIRTVAVGDFENNSIYKGDFHKLDFDLFRGAFQHLIMYDLSRATSLEVVDRQRVNQLLGEIEMNQGGFADPKAAVKAGRFLGAHCFIYGQYMIISGKEVIITARVVHTATGKILSVHQVEGEFGGDPRRFLDLEKKLVLEIAESIDSLIVDVAGEPSGIAREMALFFEERSASREAWNGYVESTLAVSEALALEDRKDYRAALEKWKEVLSLDPGNEVASRKVRIIPLLLGG